MIVQTKLKTLKASSAFTTDKAGFDMHVTDTPSGSFLGIKGVNPNSLVWADSSRVRTFWQRVFRLNK